MAQREAQLGQFGQVSHDGADLLGAAETARYGRHLTLPEVGLAGQARLRKARVAIVGLGGLGTPAAQYLAAAGVGTLGLVDGDRVDVSNLQRQVLYGDEDVGRVKAAVAADRIRSMNAGVRVNEHALRLDSSNALEVLADYDVVLDGSDNFPTRYLVNDASILLGIPNVHGSVLRFEGRVSVFGAADGPCYRCLFPEPPPPGTVPDCQDAGVLGVVSGLIGVLQALEVVRLVCGLEGSLVGRLLLIDTLSMRFESIQITRNPACPMCGTRTIRALIDYEEFCARGFPSDLVARLTPAALAGRLEPGLQLIDVREPWEWSLCRLPGARLMPLGRLSELSAELDPARETIVYCHLGSRSLDAARRLVAAGFARVAHLEGGIDRWSVDVDQATPRY